MKKNEIVARYLKNGDRFFQEVFVEGIYEPVKRLGKLGTVLDIGAFHGEFSFYVHNQADKIYAIEPQQEAYNELFKNCLGSQKIKTFQYCITDKNEDRYIEGVADGGSKTKLAPKHGNEDTHAVQGKTLATFMKENEIEEVDVLKIDIENHEGYVFGAEDFKEVKNKIKFIIGEHIDELEYLFVPIGFEKIMYNGGCIYKK